MALGAGYGDHRFSTAELLKRCPGNGSRDPA
jgi:hypothetical protein